MSHRNRWLILFSLITIRTLKGNLMSEDAISGTTRLSEHPRAGTCKELIGCFLNHKTGSLCRFMQESGWFNVERTTTEKLFSWNHAHGGYFRRFSTDISQWRNRDYDDFFRLLKSPEFYVEICTDNIRIYKHRDFSA